MRKLVWMAALSAMALFWTADFASARGHHHCGGGCGGGGCGGGGCGMGGGCGYGGCGGGGCGMGGCGGGWGGGYAGGGCPGCYAFAGGIGSYGAVAQVETQQAATLVVSLPADAKLMVDDYRSTSTAGERVFNTPALTVGQEYHYTLKAELNGRTVTKVVTVRGGEMTRVNLDLSTQTAAAE